MHTSIRCTRKRQLCLRDNATTRQRDDATTRRSHVPNASKIFEYLNRRTAWPEDEVNLLTDAVSYFDHLDQLARLILQDDKDHAMGPWILQIPGLIHYQ
jgi:hypothetical protein